MTPTNCTRCGAIVDPVALACPFCKTTTPAGVAAHQRAEQQRAYEAAHAAHASQQEAGAHRARVEALGTKALAASAAGLVICCAPASVVGLVLGLKARSAAASRGVPLPTRATLGIVLGALGTILTACAYVFGFIASERDRAANDARIVAIEAQLGDQPRRARLDNATACALAELHARRTGLNGKSTTSLERFECPGALTQDDARATLEDFTFAPSSSKPLVRVNVCFKRGDRWFVTELSTSACP